MLGLEIGPPVDEHVVARYAPAAGRRAGDQHELLVEQVLDGEARRLPGRYMTARSSVPSSRRWIITAERLAEAEMAMSGMFSRSQEIHLQQEAVPQRRMARRPPDGRDRDPEKPTSSCACCHTRTSASACFWNCSPAPVSDAPFLERSNSGRPNRSSSTRMRALTVDCVMFILRAASMKLPVSATIRNVRARAMSIARLSLR